MDKSGERVCRTCVHESVCKYQKEIVEMEGKLPDQVIGSFIQIEIHCSKYIDESSVSLMNGLGKRVSYAPPTYETGFPPPVLPVEIMGNVREIEEF